MSQDLLSELGEMNQGCANGHKYRIYAPRKMCVYDDTL